MPVARWARGTKKHKTVHVGASDMRGMVLERSSLTYVSRGATEHQPTTSSPS